MNINQNYEDAIKNGLEKFMNITNKDNLKKNMLFISMFILLYEFFCDTFIGKVKSVLCEIEDFVENTLIETVEYKNKIKNRKVNGKPNELLSTVLWFVDENAIVQDEYDLFLKIRSRRHEYVHEMEKILYNGIEQDVQLFFELSLLYQKIDLWWKKRYENFDESKLICSSEVHIMLGTLFLDPDIKSMFEKYLKTRK